MKACKNCRYIVSEGGTCPACQGTELTEKFNSQIYVFDAQNSELGKKLSAKMPGKYAVRIK
ncbi:transcription elongation factor Spt4 [Candidatus Parvarchaeota archaeon]|nr:transcription elongation factor Spt4 [Candidatus Parvarchaeota archaeon]